MAFCHSAIVSIYVSCTIFKLSFPACTRPVVSAHAARHQVVPICMEWWCTEANEATQTHCYHGLPYLGILCAWTTTQMLRGSCWPPLRQTGEDNWVVPASHGSAPFNRIWNNTILRSPKQQIWLRTALCGGWCRRMALRNRELHATNDDDDATSS